MSVEGRSRRCNDEKGQILVLFLLVFTTLVLIAFVAIAVGQTLVRRQQAQMVVDAAAFAGAARQAEGLNTIAHWNRRQLDFLQAIHVSVWGPYFDTEWQTWIRKVPPWNDWVGPVLRDYQKVFDMENSIINGANKVYSMANVVTGPVAKAREVVNANFGGDGSGDRLFRGETPLGQGPILDPSAISGMTSLVQLTDPHSYPIKGYQFAPAPTMLPYLATCSFPTFNLDACAILLAYAIANPYYETKGQVSPIRYKLGRFYENDQPEIRFAYYLKVRNTPTILGRNFLDDIPPILVVAAGKPYGGYLGYRYKSWALHVWTSERDNREISETYKAKLVPLTGTEQALLAAMSGFDDPTRFLGISH